MDGPRNPPTTPRSAAAADGGRFFPGQVLAERYRLVSLLGSGGMGEVYRADDLKLGQPVALKFLPEAFSSDPARLERFFNEVRTARQVTHQNVCRVHDLGEAGGQHFLSMEYVDGEDLASLLRRIGRVPQDKAVQIARQICAGLAAAHDQDILHRDLKPANVMLDGRGRARITDFGLAGLTESIGKHDVLTGTPEYQAPEQLAGREVTRASDIYALGLVLYELFTGKRPFEAKNRAELQQLQTSDSITSLTSHVEGLDPAIESIVMRCLDPDPARRPVTPLAVSAALPGGDPLAAALEAGETPSPEMVANADVQGALRLPIAVALLAVVLFGIGAHFAYKAKYSFIARVGLPNSPAELQFLARQFLEEIGNDDVAADSAWGLTTSGYRSWIYDTDDSITRWDNLESVRPHPVHFWFRQSPEWMRPTNYWLSLEEDSPAFDRRGMVKVRLDVEGRLLEYRRLPPEIEETDDGAADAEQETNWLPFLARAQLDPADLASTTPRTRPLVDCDQRTAWRGSYGGPEGSTLHVEACGSGGEALYFQVFPPWHENYGKLTAAAAPKGTESGADDEDDRRSDQGGSELPVTVIQIILLSAALIGGSLLARRNLRLNRADRKGAFRLGLVVLGGTQAAAMFRANYSASWGGFQYFIESVAHTLMLAVAAWVLYLAVEPFARRFWPDSLISWRRVLDGRFRDTLVARDFLIGAALAQVLILVRLTNFVPAKDPPRLAGSGSLLAISGFKWAVENLLHNLFIVLVPALGVMTVVILARLVLRKNWLTWAVLTGVVVLMQILRFIPHRETESLWFIFLAVLLIQGSIFYTSIRFGLFALVVYGIYTNMDAFFSVLDPSSWFFGYVLFYLALFVVPVLVAFWLSLGGRYRVGAG